MVLDYLLSSSKFSPMFTYSKKKILKELHEVKIKVQKFTTLRRFVGLRHRMKNKQNYSLLRSVSTSPP